MAVFPPQLPPARLSGFSANTAQPFIRTQFVTGRARQRKLYSNVPTFVNAEWILTAGQVRLFEPWFKGEINDGEAWFDIPLTLPTGTNTRRARFTEMYRGPVPFGPFKYSITVAMELQERPIFSADDYRFDPLGVEYADVFDKTVNQFLES